MFTWICPRCGREIPPSYTDCPNCGKAEQATAAGTAAPAAPAYAPPAAVAPPAPPPPAAPVASQPSFLDLVQEPSPAPPQPVESRPAAPVYQAPAPPAYQPPPPPVYQAPPPPPQQDWAPRPPYATAPSSFLGLGQAAAPQPSAPTAYQPEAPMPGMPARRRLPVWLLTVVFAALFVGLVGGVYWLVDGGSATNAKPAAAVAAVPAAAPGGAPNPYQKYIEVSGVRFLEGAKKKPQVKFVVTNHSGADITGLGGSVTILGHGAKNEVQAAGSFEFTTSIGPWESKDLTAPLVTQLEMIELPDWQYVSTNVQITSPTQ